MSCDAFTLLPDKEGGCMSRQGEASVTLQECEGKDMSQSERGEIDRYMRLS